MKSWKQKLASRKLWAAVAGVVTGLAMVFGLDEGVISNVAGAVVAASSIVTYIVTEGHVDAVTKSEKSTEDVQDAVTTDETGATVNSFDSRFNNYE
jgi:phage shock protein PspC (stress-responsive transcriptional regulator)